MQMHQSMTDLEYCFCPKHVLNCNMDCNLNSCSGIICTGRVGHVCVWLFDGLCQYYVSRK